MVANSLDPDKAWQNVRTDLGSSCFTLMIFLKEYLNSNFEKKKISRQQNIKQKVKTTSVLINYCVFHEVLYKLRDMKATKAQMSLHTLSISTEPFSCLYSQIRDVDKCSSKNLDLLDSYACLTLYLLAVKFCLQLITFANSLDPDKVGCSVCH